MTRDAFDQFTPPDRGRFGDNEDTPRNPRVTGASNLVDITVHLRHEKPAAIAVIPTDKISVKWTWLPRSMIEFVRKGAQDSTLIEVTLPEWLAKEKGLI